ncbi:MAG: DUF1858 domain-containing protein [Armatimonadota bacterium]
MAEIITRETSIAQAIRICPQAAEILSSHGMGCAGCLAASAETVGEGAEMHGLDADAVVAELNAACEN